MRGGEAFERGLIQAMPPNETDLANEKQAARKFQSSFYYAVVVPLLFITTFSGRSPAEHPAICGIAFVLSLLGWVKAKSVPSRVIGVLLTGITGGYFLLGLRDVWHVLS